VFGADYEAILIGERKRPEHDGVSEREQYRGRSDAKGEQ